MRAQRNRVPTVRRTTMARESPRDGIPAYLVTRLDWLPRAGLDLDAGMRLRTPAQRPFSRPYPHAIGALSGFMPLVDIWRALGRTQAMAPGPIIGQPSHGVLSAPGTEGYFPAWYRDLTKAF
jgi:hypothetical protein